MLSVVTMRGQHVYAVQIGKAEYILLELMRLGKTDVASIAVMTQVMLQCA